MDKPAAAMVVSAFAWAAVLRGPAAELTLHLRPCNIPAGLPMPSGSGCEASCSARKPRCEGPEPARRITISFEAAIPAAVVDLRKEWALLVECGNIHWRDVVLNARPAGGMHQSARIFCCWAWGPGRQGRNSG